MGWAQRCTCRMAHLGSPPNHTPYQACDPMPLPTSPTHTGSCSLELTSPVQPQMTPSQEVTGPLFTRVWTPWSCSLEATMRNKVDLQASHPSGVGKNTPSPTSHCQHKLEKAAGESESQDKSKGFT